MDRRDLGGKPSTRSPRAHNAALKSSAATAEQSAVLPAASAASSSSTAKPMLPTLNVRCGHRSLPRARARRPRRGFGRRAAHAYKAAPRAQVFKVRKVDAEAQQQMMGSRASSQWRPTNAAAAPPNGVSSAALAPPAAGAPRQPAPPPKVSRVAGETGSTFNAGRIHTYKFDQGRERESGAADSRTPPSPR